MSKPSIKNYLPWLLFTEAVGVISGWISREGITNFNETAIQPQITPPPILFPVVWILLYGLMGISAARIFMQTKSPERNQGLNLFIAQLIVNFFWSPVFFRGNAYGFALIWLLVLWILVLRMIQVFKKSDKIVAYLQVPYLLWLTFAAYLNWSVWKLNG